MKTGCRNLSLRPHGSRIHLCFVYYSRSPPSLFCAACATTNTAETTADSENETSATDRAIQQSQEGFGDAAASPLKDVNLIRENAPEEFKQIKNPYNVDPEISCEDIAIEVTRLMSS